jgi:hypothetical protein
MIPACEIVEKASMRFRWRCRSAIQPPRSAVTVPRPTRRTGSACWTWADPANTTALTFARPNSPSETIEPEKITETGLGATACASASQNWNGTIAPLIISAAATRQKAPATTGSRPPCATAAAMPSKSRVPVCA